MIRTVVWEVSVKIPEPCPLNGVEFEAKAAGKAPTKIMRPRMLRVKSFIVSTKMGNFLYKDSCSQSSQRSPLNSSDSNNRSASSSSTNVWGRMFAAKDETLMFLFSLFAWLAVDSITSVGCALLRSA